MKILQFAFLLFLSALGSLAYAGDTSATAAWSVIWFPANDTFRSWDWRKISGGNDNTFKIVQTDYLQKFPDEVKTWELAMCSAANPNQKVRFALRNPHSDNSFDFSSWNPGDWGDNDSRRPQLEAMGEGTFFCAILGDGKRYSNVAKVTIRRDYDVGHEPVIRLVAIQPPNGVNHVQYIGAWIVPPLPQDKDFITTVLGRPQWEIDGVWSISPGDMNGAVWPLESGISYGEIYPLKVAMEDIKPPPSPPDRMKLPVDPGVKVTILGGTEPPIHSFVKAKVRLWLSEKASPWAGLPLTSSQRGYANNYAGGLYQLPLSDPDGTSKDSSPRKVYLSQVFDIGLDIHDADRFDHSFGF
jgi:hypothetical protein